LESYHNCLQVFYGNGDTVGYFCDAGNERTIAQGCIDHGGQERKKTVDAFL